MKLLERNQTVSDSLRIAAETIKLLGLEVTEKFYGRNGHPKTYQCQLFDPARRVSFFGLGKGIDLQSKASAYYEALEHFIIYDYCQKAGSDLANYKTFSMIAPSLENLAIPSATFKSLRTNESYHYPLFLIDPRYSKKPPLIDKTPYSKIAWAASDSGTASGTSPEEASVHALNELIERHSYSRFLSEVFLNDTIGTERRAVSLIDKETLPQHLVRIIKAIESDYADELMIFDMPNEVAVPSYFVSMTKQPFPLQPRGCGTSLFSSYAVERAVLETLQPLQVWNDHLIENQKQIINNFSNYPHLRRCAVADVLTIQDRCQLTKTEVKEANIKVSVAEQFHILKNKIMSANFDAYSLEIAKIETGFACVRYVIPDFESFYLVQAGKYVLPKRKTFFPQKENLNP